MFWRISKFPTGISGVTSVATVRNILACYVSSTSPATVPQQIPSTSVLLLETDSSEPAPLSSYTGHHVQKNSSWRRYPFRGVLIYFRIVFPVLCYSGQMVGTVTSPPRTAVINGIVTVLKIS